MKATTSIVGCLLLLILNQARADDFQKIRQDDARGDYVAEAADLRPLAMDGNARAQTLLGMLYDMGTGVPQSYPKALALYKKASAQGSPVAERYLGIMYEFGHGVPRDMRQALRWEVKASKQNDPLALNQLGSMYANGNGVRTNRAFAFALYVYSVSADKDPKDGNPANRNGARLTKTMTPAEVMAGKAFIQRIHVEGLDSVLPSQ